MSREFSEFSATEEMRQCWATIDAQAARITRLETAVREAEKILVWARGPMAIRQAHEILRDARRVPDAQFVVYGSDIQPIATGPTAIEAIRAALATKGEHK